MRRKHMSLRTACGHLLRFLQFYQVCKLFSYMLSHTSTNLFSLRDLKNDTNGVGVCAPQGIYWGFSGLNTSHPRTV